MPVPSETTPTLGAENEPRRDDYEPLDRPLFGESTRRDRLINLIVGSITFLMVLFSIISAFVWPLHHSVNSMNVYFAICILLISVAHLMLIFWYRQGDLDPKFRKLIYYNAFTMVLLCICANLFIHEIGDPKKTS